MAVLHCFKCGRELWFMPTRRRRRDFWCLCACGIMFTPKETGRQRRRKPKPEGHVIETNPGWKPPRHWRKPRASQAQR